MATIGKNILDNLTTGMYTDSIVMYREYIQNACDQIDLAIKHGLLSKSDGEIEINVDDKKRLIIIKDNATGVKAAEFRENLGDIANSNKQLGENKGFRGIGRLCGLAYCKTLTFTTSYAGENIASIMTCDAKKMRDMIYEKKKYTVDDIWDTVVKYDTCEADVDSHYFEVCLLDIRQECSDLLDEKHIKEYLNFVAPAPYKNTFILRNDVCKHAESVDYTIDEYRIFVNGSQIFKEYSTKLKEPNGNSLKLYDEISKLEFHDFYSSDGTLLAWVWIGLSRFEKSIPKVNHMRGLRIRSGNIQIGNDDVVQKLFKEARGNYYFVGEIFAVDSLLIPNSQRDYFNENEKRVEFEDELRKYFYDTLHKLYTDANKIKNAYKRQAEYIEKAQKFNEDTSNGFVDDKARHDSEIQLERAKKEADEAVKQLKKFSGEDVLSPISIIHKNIGAKYNAKELRKQVEQINDVDNGADKKKVYVTDSMSKLSRNERKLIGKLLSVVNEVAPKDIADEIIAKIKEELR